MYFTALPTTRDRRDVKKEICIRRGDGYKDEFIGMKKNELLKKFDCQGPFDL